MSALSIHKAGLPTAIFDHDVPRLTGLRISLVSRRAVVRKTNRKSLPAAIYSNRSVYPWALPSSPDRREACKVRSTHFQFALRLPLARQSGGRASLLSSHRQCGSRVLSIVVRKKDQAERQEDEAILDLYKNALGMA